MSWRTVIISSTAKLDYQMGYLVIRKDDVTKIHLSEIETVMIESTSVSLTAALLCELTKKKIKVIFCDEKRNPSSELISYYGAHDLSELWSGLSLGVKMTEAEYAKKSIKEHEDIIESMKKYDTMEAWRRMHQHIERSLEDVLSEF